LAEACLSSSSSLFVTLKTAKALGVTVPPVLLAHTHEVIGLAVILLHLLRSGSGTKRL
jgi:hypothetical protein